jgi:hypothetical protein
MTLRPAHTALLRINAIILTTALMMTASMQAMEQNEKTAILPVSQSIPAEDLRQQVFKLKEDPNQLEDITEYSQRSVKNRNKEAKEEAKLFCSYLGGLTLCCTKWILFCPCMYYTDCVKPAFCGNSNDTEQQ